jgi:two-component system phosphate regulon response regulator OmpR
MSAATHPPKAPRVLVVDDDRLMRATLELVLTTEGYAVELAASGRQAIDRCREETFQLVVLDYWMPGLTGFDVAQWLRKEGNRVPCVVFTSCLEPGLKDAGAALGIPVVDKLNWRELVALAASLRHASPAAA